MRVNIKYGIGDEVTDGTYTGVVRYISWNKDELGEDLKYLVQPNNVAWRVTMREESMTLISKSKDRRVRRAARLHSTHSRKREP